MMTMIGRILIIIGCLWLTPEAEAMRGRAAGGRRQQQEQARENYRRSLDRISGQVHAAHADLEARHRAEQDELARRADELAARVDSLYPSAPQRPLPDASQRSIAAPSLSTWRQAVPAGPVPGPSAIFPSLSTSTWRQAVPAGPVPGYQPIGVRRQREEEAPRESDRSITAQDECTICLKKFGEASAEDRNDAGKAVILTCGHALHVACYDALRQGDRTPKCPVCRARLQKLIEVTLQ